MDTFCKYTFQEAKIKIVYSIYNVTKFLIVKLHRQLDIGIAPQKTDQWERVSFWLNLLKKGYSIIDKVDM